MRNLNVVRGISGWHTYKIFLHGIRSWCFFKALASLPDVQPLPASLDLFDRWCPFRCPPGAMDCRIQMAVGWRPSRGFKVSN